VRLEHLSLGDLADIDNHPLVYSCGRCTRLVADEYVRHIVQAPTASARRPARSASPRRGRSVQARGDPASAGGGQAERAKARCTQGGPRLSGAAAAPVAAEGASGSPGPREASAPVAAGRPCAGLAAEMQASPQRQPCVQPAAEVEAGSRRHDSLAPPTAEGDQPSADSAAAGSQPARAAAAGVRRRLRMA